MAYYDPVLVSHAQHLQMTRAYFDHVEESENLEENTRRRDSGASAREAEEATLAELQEELDQITDEANRRIEKGNESILRLKAQLKQLRDVELVQLQREHSEAEKRLATLQLRNQDMKEQVDEQRGNAVDEELDKLKKDVLVLTNQKAALMKMVQDIYGSAQQDNAPGTIRTLVHDAAARALADIRVCTNSVVPEDMEGECNLLPDPHEFLGAEPLKPL